MEGIFMGRGKSYGLRATRDCSGGPNCSCRTRTPTADAMVTQILDKLRELKQMFAERRARPVADMQASVADWRRAEQRKVQAVNEGNRTFYEVR
jgi:hypothetical protein